ncbi:MAG: 4Fe-4S binding protein, partial [Candidatus Hydrogenedentes bacterium]|nr:4Fe-4S binding protein [Candidatus Hydrogenedentota bacterium]
MVIDLDRCTGCQSCVIACKSENNVPFVDEEQTRLGRGISWMEIVREIHGEG